MVGTWDGLYSLTIALGAHKALAAYALGVTFVRAEIGAVRHGLLVLLFATFTPLGMVGGIFISEAAAASESTLSSVAAAVIAGTFLYIAIVEVRNPAPL